MLTFAKGQPSFYEYFGLTQDPTSSRYAYTTQISGACNGLAQAGGFFGCFLCAWIRDRWGSVPAFRVASVLCIVGGAIQAGSTNLSEFLVFRFINGLGVGMCLTATPLYQSELSPPASRGVLVGCHGAFLAIGYNIASWTGLGCFFATNDSFKWRFPLALQVLFPFILLLGSFWLPESPRWLVTKNRLPEAKSVLESLHGSKDDHQQTFAHAEFEQIVAQLELERRQRHDRHRASHPNSTTEVSNDQGVFNEFMSLMTHLPHRRRAVLGFTIMFGAQCTGVLVINNYQVILFPSLGISPALSLGLYSVYLAIAFVGNSLCGYIVDRVGRRPCLLIGLCGCLVALVGETITAKFAADPGAGRGILSAAVFFIFLYIPFFSTLIDPNMYIYASEIFPAEVRSIGVAVSMSGKCTSENTSLRPCSQINSRSIGQWLATICFLQSAPVAFANIGYRFYIVFIVCTVALFFIVYRWFPETAGRSLEEMAEVFGDDVAVHLDEEIVIVRDQEDKKISQKGSIVEKSEVV